MLAQNLVLTIKILKISMQQTTLYEQMDIDVFTVSVGVRYCTQHKELLHILYGKQSHSSTTNITWLFLSLPLPLHLPQPLFLSFPLPFPLSLCLPIYLTPFSDPASTLPLPFLCPSLCNSISPPCFPSSYMYYMLIDPK